MVEIIEAKTRKQMREFAKFPCDLYEGSKYYVPSLRGDDVNMANPKKNLNAQYCDIKCFLAYKDGKIVGRIAGIIHKKYNSINKKKTIRFSRFDFIDDSEVSAKLMEAVIGFGKENGMTLLHGPWGFNDTDREGLLTDGFDKRATYATNYNYEYYAKHLIDLGFERESEWTEFKFIIADKMDERIHKMANMLKKKFHLRDVTETMSLKKFIKVYRDEFFDVFNECYSSLDNYVKIEGEEKKNVLNQFATIINERYYSAIVNEKDELVAYGIIIPSIADALIKSRGRLSLDLVKSIAKPTGLECASIGVRPDYQKLGVSVLLVDKILTNIIEDGIVDVESNPMLITNTAIRNQFSHFKYEEVKKRCTFKKEI